MTQKGIEDKDSLLSNLKKKLTSRFRAPVVKLIKQARVTLDKHIINSKRTSKNQFQNRTLQNQIMNYTLNLRRILKKLVVLLQEFRSLKC